jgi:hypothetical protein
MEKMEDRKSGKAEERKKKQKMFFRDGPVVVQLDCNGTYNNFQVCIIFTDRRQPYRLQHPDAHERLASLPQNPAFAAIPAQPGTVPLSRGQANRVAGRGDLRHFADGEIQAISHEAVIRRHSP